MIYAIRLRGSEVMVLLESDSGEEALGTLRLNGYEPDAVEPIEAMGTLLVVRSDPKDNRAYVSETR